MYLLMTVLLVAVFPLASILVEEVVLHGHGVPLLLIGKWFVFWAVGVRMLTTGLRQVMDPGLTAETVFRIHDPAATRLVSELGFGNLAIGGLGVLTLLYEGWITPAAIVGAVALGLSGMKHVLNPGRNRQETIVMIADIAVAAVLIVYLSGLYFATLMVVRP